MTSNTRAGLLVLVLLFGSTAWGASLTPLGVLNEGGAYSSVRALSSDGAWAVGGSTDAAGVVNPWLWSREQGLQPLPNPGGVSSWPTGVDVRAAVGRIAISGMVNRRPQRYDAPLGPGLTSGAWATLPGQNIGIGEYNALGAHPDGDLFFIAGWQTGGGCTPHYKAYRYRGSTTRDDYFSLNMAPDIVMSSVSGNGTLVGISSTLGNPGRAVSMQPPSCAAECRSLPGADESVGLGISADGAWFTGSTSLAGVGYGFRWRMGDPSAMQLLPTRAGVACLGLDVAADGTAVGWSTEPGGATHATFWPGGDNPHAAGVALRGWLSGQGVNTSDWAALTRVVSISSDGQVIAGDGIWAADGSTRAWVAVIPEPGVAVGLAPLAILALRRRRMQNP